jgi:hypothetical protein
VLGLAVVGTERDPRGTELTREGDQRLQVACRRGLADQQPHSRPQPLAALLDRERLVVRVDPGRRVGVEGLADDSGSVSVDVSRARERELRELVLVAGDDAGEVHHLCEADHTAPAQQSLEVAGREWPPR